MNPKIAAVQMTSTDDVAHNLETAGRLLAAAKGAGAALAALPENFAFMGAKDRDKLAHGEPEGSGPIQSFLAATASRLGLWIVAGSVPVAVPGDPEHVYAASLVFNAAGRRVGRYDKTHLFDVDVPRDGKIERYRESASIAPGAFQARVVDTPVGRLGLTVCYDVRFPELYRALAAAGAEVLCIPAAFTVKTGEAHWEILLRARAIENLCFVVAPGQCGTHPGGRGTWGHSMIVGPWGDVLAQRADGEGVAVAEVDRERQQQVRETFPALTHRRG